MIVFVHDVPSETSKLISAVLKLPTGFIMSLLKRQAQLRNVNYFENYRSLPDLPTHRLISKENSNLRPHVMVRDHSMFPLSIVLSNENNTRYQIEILPAGRILLACESQLESNAADEIDFLMHVARHIALEDEIGDCRKQFPRDNQRLTRNIADFVAEWRDYDIPENERFTPPLLTNEEINELYSGDTVRQDLGYT